MLSAATHFSRLGECRLWRCASGEAVGAIRTDDLSESAKNAFVILPIPAFDKNGVLNGCANVTADDLFRHLPCGSVIFGGKISALVSRLAAEHGHKIYDYGERDDFNLFNAVPTAEAALLIASEHLNSTVNGSDFVITGYGRIGKALARRLRLLGGNVTVAARSDSAVAGAVCDGNRAVRLSDLSSELCETDVCFNTVPYKIFSPSIIREWKCKWFMELASLPGGFSEDAISFLGDRYISALSLPGRYFPITAGEIIYKTVYTMICTL